MPKKSKLLNTIGEHFSDIEIDVKQIPISELKNLTICMKDLTDYRNNASYKLLENSVMITFPESGRCPGEGNGDLLQYPSLENPVDRGAWWVTVHGVSKSWRRVKRLGTHTHITIARP